MFAAAAADDDNDDDASGHIVIIIESLEKTRAVVIHSANQTEAQ